jgi:hypothetical protein
MRVGQSERVADNGGAYLMLRFQLKRVVDGMKSYRKIKQR